MDFAIISPTAGLERYATLSKTHLVLAHITDQAYVDFYMKRKAEGDFIILDNGAYEGEAMDHVDLISRINSYEPHVAVLPDYLLQPWKKTWHAATHFLDKYYDKHDFIQWLYIPQAEKGDIHGFMESYITATEDPRITWLGVPRSLPLSIANNPLARVEFARMVRERHPYLHLHAFGMANGDVHELGYLAQAGVKSIDSSAPVWRGWRNLSLTKPEDRKWWDEHGMAVDFSESAPQEHECYHKQTLVNLEACGVNTTAVRV